MIEDLADRRKEYRDSYQLTFSFDYVDVYAVREYGTDTYTINVISNNADGMSEEELEDFVLALKGVL